MTLKYSIWHMKHENYCSDKTNFYIYLLDHETAKIANEIAKIPKSVKRVVFYIQKTGFFSS